MRPCALSGSSAVLLLLAVFPQIAPGQNQPSVQASVRDPQALALASTSLMSMGTAAVSSQTDSRATGILTVHSQTQIVMNLVLESKSLTETRAELQQPNGTSVRIVQAGRGVILQPDGSVRRLLSNNTFYEHPNYIPVFSLLAEIQNPAADVEVVSRSVANGTPDDVISVGLGFSADPKQAAIERQLSQTLFSINTVSGLVDKIEYTYHAEGSPGTPIRMQEVYSDYRNVNGVLVPFHQSTIVDGQPESDMQLTSFTFNAGVPQSDFAIPVSAQ